MRWQGQELTAEDDDALPGLSRAESLVRSVTTPEFAGVVFHEVLARSALNHVPGSSSRMPMEWTINPYRGCQHACVYCFARNTHTYLDLDAGHDFDSQIIVKTNVGEVLARELRTKARDLPVVHLGTNTDPYQRAEGRYRLMPRILRELAAARVPISILTKGTLLRRDLPLLAELAERVPVSVAMSIALYDDDLQASLEPGVPSARARLATVAAVRELGLPCDVFLMPVLPHLSDSEAQLRGALESISDAGASRVLYTALHLRPGTKQWFFSWLHEHRPDLESRYRALYKGAYAPPEYRKALAARIRPLIRSYGLDRPGMVRRPASSGARVAFDESEMVQPPTPTLF